MCYLFSMVQTPSWLQRESRRKGRYNRIDLRILFYKMIVPSPATQNFCVPLLSVWNWSLLIVFQKKITEQYYYCLWWYSCAGTFQRNSRNIGLLYCVCHSSSYTFQQIRKMQRYLKCFYFFSILKRIRYIWTTRYDKYTNMYWLLHIVFIHTYLWSIQWKFQSFRVNLFLTCTFCSCKNQTLIYSFFFKRSHICHCNINFHMPYKKSDISSV